MAIKISGNTVIDDSQNITSTGTGTFTSTVTANIFESTGRNEINLAADGTALAIQKEGGTVGNLGVDGTIFTIGAIGNSTGSIEFTTKIGSVTTPKLTIANSGAATFAGDVNIGEYDGTSTTTDGVLLGAVGGVYSQLASATASTGVVFQGMHGATFTSRITANGTSYFNGDMGLGTLYPTQKLDVRGNVYIGDDLTADGSAQFGGDVSALGYAASVGAGPNAYVFAGYNDEASTTLTSSIDRYGAATFAGDGHFKCGGTAHAEMGVQFINDGEVKIYRPTGGGGTVNLISGSAGVGSPSEQFAIKADGSATFAGTITADGYSFANLDPLP